MLGEEAWVRVGGLDRDGDRVVQCGTGAGCGWISGLSGDLGWIDGFFVLDMYARWMS